MKPNRTPDRFVQLGRQWMSLLAEKRERLYIAVGVLVAIGVGIVIWQNVSSSRENAAWEAFYSASKKPEAERWAALREVYKKYSSSRGGYLAAVTVADQEASEARKKGAKPGTPGEKNAAESVDWYGKALGFSGITEEEKAWLQINRGEAMALQGKRDEALAELKKAAEGSGDPKAYALFQQGAMEEDRGDRKKALEHYEKVASGAENAFTKTAKVAVRRLRGNLLSGVTVDNEAKAKP